MGFIQDLLSYLPILAQYFLAFAFLITVVVFFHELGHYLIGRFCGIGIETFSIGMGK
ncbi:MAG: site-2 protease family protein, partial [Pseudomonadota bacterium]|nr:site-2 protease family protein [Pseudomonadota bacterium]